MLGCLACADGTTCNEDLREVRVDCDTEGTSSCPHVGSSFEFIVDNFKRLLIRSCSTNLSSSAYVENSASWYSDNSAQVALMIDRVHRFLLICHVSERSALLNLHGLVSVQRSESCFVSGKWSRMRLDDRLLDHFNLLGRLVIVSLICHRV